MKWLVLTLPENFEKAASIVSFIKEHGADCCVHQVSTVSLNGAINNCDAVRLQKVVNQLKETTHCIFLDFEVFQHSSTLMYIMGVLAGRQIPVFITGKEVPLSKVLFGENLQRLGKTSDLLEVLQKYFGKYLLKEKVQDAINKIDERGLQFTPDAFIKTVAHMDFEIAQFFLDAKMDINSKNTKGIPAISVAIRRKKTEAVKWLILHGADVNCTADDRGYTPVMDAVLKSNYELTELLVSHGAFLDTIGKDGQSILGLAVGAENEEVSKLLFKHGANPDVKDVMNMSARDYAKLFNKTRLLALFDSKK